MKSGDLVYPWSDSGDYTIVLYLGEKFYDWKGEPHGAFLWEGQRYTIAIRQLKKVENENRKIS